MLPIKPEYVNSYLENSGTSVISSRKRLSDLISRPQTKLNDIIDLVPRGTFSKFNINLEKEFSSPLSDILKPGVEYSDILKYGNYSSLSELIDEEYVSGSFKDASYILKSNTEYPVSLLDESNLNKTVDENYRREIIDSTEISIKYKGYIQREQQMADKIMRLENLSIPENFDFDKVESLSIECRQKLKKYRPLTIAQASRISGVSPADISVLLVYFGR